MAYCCTQSVSLSVCLSVCHVHEPCENGWTGRDAVWEAELGVPKEPCVRWGTDPNGKSQFLGLSAPLKCLGRLCDSVRKNSWTDRDVVWGPKEPLLDGVKVGRIHLPAGGDKIRWRIFEHLLLCCWCWCSCWAWVPWSSLISVYHTSGLINVTRLADLLVIILITLLLIIRL